MSHMSAVFRNDGVTPSKTHHFRPICKLYSSNFGQFSWFCYFSFFFPQFFAGFFFLFFSSSSSSFFFGGGRCTTPLAPQCIHAWLWLKWVLDMVLKRIHRVFRKWKPVSIHYENMTLKVTLKGLTTLKNHWNHTEKFYKR